MAAEEERKDRGQRRGSGRGGEVDAIELEDAPSGDLETAMREALAAVEAVEGAETAGSRLPLDPAAPAGAAEGVDGADFAAASSGLAESPASEMTRLRREIADLRDRSMRTLADFDNYRKRAERERQEVRRYALLEPLRELLPVADNLERALGAGGSADDLRRGVEMILRQLHELLRRLGVHEVPSAGEAFDPALHEAVSREESAEVRVPTVAETLVRGYQLHDRLLRPAMVKVAVPAEDPAPAGGDGPPGRGETSR
jgi:molecular chaperone GrpE